MAECGWPDGYVNLQTWGLDALGNWATFTDGTDDQTRAFNEANEIDVDNPHSNAPGNSISGDLDWVDPVYDAAGNMISGPKPGAETTRLHFVYDAWNRMTGAYTDDGDGVFEPGGDDALAGSYAYDGQGRRITKTVDSVPQDFYWNEQYQNVETRKNGSADPLDQIVYDERYVDAPIVRLHDGNTDGDYADTEDNTDSILFVTSDANFNVTGIVDASTGVVVEHYAFTPYGERTMFDASWIERGTSSFDWIIGHQGLAYDTDTGLVYNRARYLHTSLGVFMIRDPLGYVDGMNLCVCGASAPNKLDPAGTQANPPFGLVTLPVKIASNLIPAAATMIAKYVTCTQCMTFAVGQKNNSFFIAPPPVDYRLKTGKILGIGLWTKITATPSCYMDCNGTYALVPWEKTPYTWSWGWTSCP